MATTYEGIYYQAKVITSNRTGIQVEFTGMSDRVFNVPTNRAAVIKAQLESGTCPDQIAKSLPLDW
jgi:hypothetical protein